MVERQLKWTTICPSAFQGMDRRKLPNLMAHDLALGYSEDSLLLHGKTGRGKTRCAWEILRVRYLAGANFYVMDSASGFAFGAKYGKGAEAVKFWLDYIIRIDVVLLDDVFKAKMTDAYDAFLYAMVDQRISNCRQVIVTCNDTGETLSERLSQDRCEPMIRRLRESCHAIAF